MSQFYDEVAVKKGDIITQLIPNGLNTGQYYNLKR